MLNIVVIILSLILTIFGLFISYFVKRNRENKFILSDFRQCWIFNQNRKRFLRAIIIYHYFGASNLYFEMSKERTILFQMIMIEHEKLNYTIEIKHSRKYIIISFPLLLSNNPIEFFSWFEFDIVFHHYLWSLDEWERKMTCSERTLNNLS